MQAILLMNQGISAQNSLSFLQLGQVYHAFGIP
jgi:hypothetical protein